MPEHLPEPSESLSQEQQLILSGFSQVYGRNTIVNDAHSAAVYDQAVAEMRTKLTDGFMLEVQSPKEFYDVIAGALAATSRVEQLTEAGMSIKQAVEITRIALAGLNPQQK